MFQQMSDTACAVCFMYRADTQGDICRKRWRDMALYPDGTSHGLTGAEAQQIYNEVVSETFSEIGAYAVFSGSVEHLVLGTDDEWEVYNLVYYPSVQDLVIMTTDPRWRAAHPNKDAGLSRNSVMMTTPLIEPAMP